MTKPLSLLTFLACGLCLSCSQNQRPRVTLRDTSPTAVPSQLSSPRPEKSAATETDLEKRPANFFVDGDQLSVAGFTFEKRIRKEHDHFYEQHNDPRNLVDIEYVIVKKGKRVVAKFDAGIGHPLGNWTSFGLYPFLGGDSRQAYISTDVRRGGCQWVVSLSPRFRVIFDGQALNVGREAFELSAIDLDNDGVSEIIEPITDFYQLQDKLSISAIPLPDIIFKYDPAKERYLPANAVFKNRVFKRLDEVPNLEEKDSLNFKHCAVVLSNLLIYVYAGEQMQGWETFEKDYKFADKTEMKRRVKAILRDQPVYKFIYQR